MMRAIKTHLTDFVAIIVLLVLSVAVAGYILSHERFRFPLIDASPFTLNAAFSTAQAVTPGQGQSVRISGVQVGEIGSVTLKNGEAIVQMQLDPQYKHLIHTNATALLRPKTGLKDMFIELVPGNKSAPVAKQGWTLPVSNTLPDIDADEILSSLDGDTRNYLQLLVNGAGQGLQGKGGTELAQVFERFEPTHQDLARLNKAVAVRGTDLRTLVNSLQRLNTALSHNQGQIVRLVDASSTVFRAFASQDTNISKAISLLPGTLAQTTDTLNKVTTFANLLGPTAKNLLPAAKALPAANAAVTALAKPSAPIVQNQIRPFVVAARPLVRNLKPAAENLAAATPSLTKTFDVVKRFTNMLGYNPGDTEHGYLWWLAWLDHNIRTLFSVQDANGDFRPLFLQASCATYTQIVDGLNQASGGLGSEFESVFNLTPILTTAGVCPTQAAANQADYQKYEAQKQSLASNVSSTAGTPTGGASNAVGGAAKALAPFDPNLPVK
jgi:phospholipid/cholesterol/gamma-HCH transport system substrate-binding protein